MNRPSGAFTGPPAPADGSPDPAVIDDTAGDPGNTHLVIDVQPPDTRPLLIKELRIKVLRRAPAPPPTGPRSSAWTAGSAAPLRPP
ncbi:hypothetical protein ACFU93_43170 [Streptomyces sp. NPDC057611]|uniref:hypothetical protein n=1 Tax=Streptomyces sp. NPDC057611 TaxID=3346182 RepID=UPI0036C5A1D9